MAELHNLTDSREFLNNGRAIAIGGEEPGWHGVTAEELAETLDELSEEDGDFADNVSRLFSGPMTLVEEGSLVAPEGDKEPGLIPALIGEDGSLKALKLPRICASDDGKEVVLVVGDYVGTCEVSGKTLKVGGLKGDIESQRQESKDKSKTWYSFDVTFKSAESGDRFVVQVRTQRDLDKPGFDDACDEGRLVSVLDTNKAGGFAKALNMATLDITPKGQPGYPVLEVRKINITGDRPRSFNVLVIEKDGAPVEVASRSSIDALLNSGYDVARIRAAGKAVELRIFAKNAMPGREGVFEVEAALRKVDLPALKEAAPAANRARRLTAKKAEPEVESALAEPDF
jgi:hypothetical protein